MQRLCIALVIVLAAALGGCAQKNSIFPEPGDNIASPSAMAVDVAGNRMYLVNSNAEVLYDWTKGSFQVLDITSPTAPKLLKSTETPSFSGQVYIDTTRGQAFIPNRYSVNTNATADQMLIFNIDQTSGNFMSYVTQELGLNPYAISCCYPVANERAWITTSDGRLQYIDISSGIFTPGNLTLKTTLDSGGTITNAEVNHIALLGSQAFLSREYGGIMVANLDKAGVAGAVAVDYFIGDIQNPRGIATDGRYIYIVGEGDIDGDWHRYLMVLDCSSLAPLSSNTSTVQVDSRENNLLVAMIEVDENPQEVLLTTKYAFVTNQDVDTVSVIDLASLTKVTDITVGDEPFSLALYRTAEGVDQYLYIGNVESNTISIIDIPSLSVVATYP